MNEKCKSCINDYPSVECVNCGEKHYNFVSKYFPSYLDYHKETKPTTNYDKIKNMSIDEISEIIHDNVTRNVCDLICDGKCNAVKTLDKSSDEVCKEIIRNWLNADIKE